MKKLVEIDTVKCRMQDARTALTEADNWSTLLAEANELFESNEMDLVAEKLIGMQNSLSVLKVGMVPSLCIVEKLSLNNI